MRVCIIIGVEDKYLSSLSRRLLMADSPAPKAPDPKVKINSSAKGSEAAAEVKDAAASMPIAPSPQAEPKPDLQPLRSEAEERNARREEALKAQQAADKEAGADIGSPVLYGQADEYTITTPPTGPAPLPTSFPPAPEYDLDPVDVSPDLSATGTSAESVAALADLDDLTLVPAARIGPSEPPRNPDSKAPCVPGAWPLPEDQLPAVQQLDHAATGDGDDLPFEGSAESGYSLRSKAGSILKLSSEESAAASQMWRGVRAQYPQFTLAQINDEFRLRWESQIGASQSMRPVDEVSPHGSTAVGDFRLDAPTPIAALREKAPEAQPQPRLAELAAEPALAAPDDAKTEGPHANPESQV